jgi:uncharacterized membrane protein
MQSMSTKLALFFLFCAAASLALLVPVLRNRAKPGIVGLLLVVVGASVWSVTSAVFEFVASPLSWWVTANVRMLGVTVVVVGLFVGVVEYTGRVAPTRRVLAAFAGSRASCCSRVSFRRWGRTCFSRWA